MISSPFIEGFLFELEKDAGLKRKFMAGVMGLGLMGGERELSDIIVGPPGFQERIKARIPSKKILSAREESIGDPSLPVMDPESIRKWLKKKK